MICLQSLPAYPWVSRAAFQRNFSPFLWLSRCTTDKFLFTTAQYTPSYFAHVTHSFIATRFLKSAFPFHYENMRLQSWDCAFTTMWGLQVTITASFWIILHTKLLRMMILLSSTYCRTYEPRFSTCKVKRVLLAISNHFWGLPMHLSWLTLEAFSHKITLSSFSFWKLKWFHLPLANEQSWKKCPGDIVTRRVLIHHYFHFMKAPPNLLINNSSRK